MIRQLRYALSIVRDLSMILCPASASVRAEVVAARDADVLAEREERVEVWEGYKFGPSIACPGVGSDAGFPGASSPMSGHPVEELVEFHHVDRITGDGIYCACHHRSRNFHQHAKHVAGFVLAMVEADARMSAATNRFQK